MEKGFSLAPSSIRQDSSHKAETPLKCPEEAAVAKELRGPTEIGKKSPLVLVRPELHGPAAGHRMFALLPASDWLTACARNS